MTFSFHICVSPLSSTTKDSKDFFQSNVCIYCRPQFNLFAEISCRFQHWCRAATVLLGGWWLEEDGEQHYALVATYWPWLESNAKVYEDLSKELMVTKILLTSPMLSCESLSSWSLFSLLVLILSHTYDLPIHKFVLVPFLQQQRMNKEFLPVKCVYLLQTIVWILCRDQLQIST
jgi:hypothetical protein